MPQRGVGSMQGSNEDCLPMKGNDILAIPKQNNMALAYSTVVSLDAVCWHRGQINWF